MIEGYIYDYINYTMIITGNNEDYIISCSIKYALNENIYISSQVISKILLNYKSIKKNNEGFNQLKCIV